MHVSTQFEVTMILPKRNFVLNTKPSMPDVSSSASTGVPMAELHTRIDTSKEVSGDVILLREGRVSSLHNGQLSTVVLRLHLSFECFVFSEPSNEILVHSFFMLLSSSCGGSTQWSTKSTCEEARRRELTVKAPHTKA
jgi:hypothetical protein